MGSTISIDHTILGKSLLGKTFITKVPFYYKKYSDGSEGFSNYITSNYDCKFDKGMKFTIHHVDRRWSVDAGFSLHLHIKVDYENIMGKAIIMSVSDFNLTTPKPFTFTMSPNEVNFDIPININTDIVDIC
jgi:hypothetical protein